MTDISTMERIIAESRRLARGRDRLAQMTAKQSADEATHAERVHEFALAALKKTGVTAADLPAFVERLRGLIDARDNDDGAGDETADKAVSLAPASTENVQVAPRTPPADAAVHLVIRKGSNPAKAAELREAGWRWYGKHGGYWHCHAAPAELDRRIADAREIFGDDVVVEKDPPRQPATTAATDDVPGRDADATSTADADQSPAASKA